MLSMLFPAKDSTAFQRCGNCPCSSSWWLMGRQRGWVCWRPCHLWPILLLWPFRVWAGHCGDVWGLQQLLLLCLPREDSSSTRLCKKKSALPTLPLSKSLEPLWWWLQGFFNKNYEKSNKINYKLYVEHFKVLITLDALVLEMFTKCNKLGVLSALFNPKITITLYVLYMIYCNSVV